MPLTVIISKNVFLPEKVKKSQEEKDITVTLLKFQLISGKSSHSGLPNNGNLSTNMYLHILFFPPGLYTRPEKLLKCTRITGIKVLCKQVSSSKVTKQHDWDKDMSTDNFKFGVIVLMAPAYKAMQ